MNARRHDRNRRLGGDEEGCIGLDATMLSLGWLMPQGLADVAWAETELPIGTVPLHDSLRDPRGVLEGAGALPSPLPLTSSEAPEVGAALARAAREGKPIPDDVQKRMRRDRRAAEDGAREPHDGEDVG